MSKALIGYTGFVGNTLLGQTHFDSLYNSKNIDQIAGKEFDLIVCAGAPGFKWIANKNPEADRDNINSLIAKLKTVKAKKFILISTIDVFKKPIAVDEDSKIDTENLHAYGLHRYQLELFVKDYFSDFHIFRLPGLVGSGLRKNVLFDFLNNNYLEGNDCRSIFQYYPISNLWADIVKSINLKIQLLHLSVEPLSVEEIAEQGFSFSFKNHKNESLVQYDFKSKYSGLFGRDNGYLYSKAESLAAIKEYALSKS